MITTLEGYVAVLAGIGARNSQRRHNGLSPGIGEAHEFSRGHHPADALRYLVLELGRQRKDSADVHTLARRSVDTIVSIAEDDRAVSEPVVNVLIAVDVPDACALAVIDVDRLVVPPIPEVGRNAERHFADCSCEVLVGF